MAHRAPYEDALENVTSLSHRGRRHVTYVSLFHLLLLLFVSPALFHRLFVSSRIPYLPLPSFSAVSPLTGDPFNVSFKSVRASFSAFAQTSRLSFGGKQSAFNRRRKERTFNVPVAAAPFVVRSYLLFEETSQTGPGNDDYRDDGDEERANAAYVRVRARTR